ncbi:ArsR/SmtB family transcription factor [Arthrobacter castelli]|uniref:ArsR/SmtB family transcription factor n=1 Tax=Arthrobacter castelli TaxID=271431 RepID=UPI0003FF6E3C|nr:metalloregulator ArsR/SmtB family transcription factor [Arthrobacter castelli]
METLDNAAPAADTCCTPGAGPVIDEQEAQRKARILKAFADPKRLQLLSIIKAGDSAETCVCNLTEPLELGQPTVSHHLKILVDAGFLTRRRRGTWAYYSLVPGALESAAAELVDL